MRKVFITTTLPYINSKPHVGHMFEFILGDVITKYLRMLNLEWDVKFNTGLDEHGLKVFQKAQELGLDTQEYVDRMAKIWVEFCAAFHIDYDSFYRTSDKYHHLKVREFWMRLTDRDFNDYIQAVPREEWGKAMWNNNIYKKTYKGLYCVGCESFKPEKDLVNGKCPDHPNTDIVESEEENYFFALTKYKQKLLDWAHSNPLIPENKLQELLNMIENVEDISISRKKESCPWGVQVPGDSSQTIYVWFDALLNYIFAAGYLTEYDAKPKDYFHWDTVIQICGPDNLRFQGVIFQGLLASMNIKLTDVLLVHGTINDAEGRKMSKTLGNVIDPMEQLEKYGLDAVRYYSIAGLNTTANSKWSEEELVNMFNADICDGWGNLVSRVLHLIDVKCDRKVIDPESSFEHGLHDDYQSVFEAIDKFDLREAMKKISVLVKEANLYINDTKPWAETDEQIRLQVLSNLYHLIHVINDLYQPIFPDRCREVSHALEVKKKAIIFRRIEK